jgi:glycosyltransferase involved in cell wall biosynthesis
LNEPYIAYAGRLDEIKGVHILIDALAILRAKFPKFNLKVRIAGSGDEQYIDLLKQRVRQQDCDGSITFLGELNAEQLAQLLNQALFSIVPSLWYENLPNTILESYACGTPVLASNLGSLPESVEEGRTGYLFNPGDASDLAERLAFCLDRPEEIAEMGRNSHIIAETIYSKEQHVNKLEALFAELLDRKASKK